MLAIPRKCFALHLYNRRIHAKNGKAKEKLKRKGKREWKREWKDKTLYYQNL